MPPTTGAAVLERPSRTVPTDQGEPRVKPSCRRAGCTREAAVIWTEQKTGETLAYCPEDGAEAFNLMLRWLGEPDARVHAEEHSCAIEKAAGRGLYEQPMRWRPDST